jgi:4-hydroxythreonine-4-phosphate dehydrogenase
MKTDFPASRVRLGITMGCPAGVGPEIIIKAFVQMPLWLASDARFTPVVFGDKSILERARAFLGADMPIRAVLPDEPLLPGAINLFQISDVPPDAIEYGISTPLTGVLSYRYVEKAIEFCQTGAISGMVTAPINKYGLHLAGIPYPGHTEIIAEKTGAKKYAMMLAGDRLKVVLVTMHCALRDVPILLTKEKIHEIISITDRALRRDFGIQNPRIAVAGLNPHAGESGMFGHEEEDIIAPAIDLSRAAGIDATGPYPPDTVFYSAVNGRFDAVVCQYHDQGLIPLKLLHFRDGVNITLGLPIVRTSVDHGTAYDIAGKGKADPSSLIAAVDMAYNIIRNRSASS